MYDYAGQLAVVTGAANGIGRAIAKRLAAEGCAVVLWDIDAPALESTCAEIEKAGGKASRALIDVTDLAGVEAAFDHLDAHGGIDILVNNAGTGQVASIIDDKPEDFAFTMQLNVFGVFNCCHAVVPRMMARSSGRIVNIASWFGKVGRPSSLAYNASKFAVLGMTQSMALDLAPHGIRVNAICPGAIANTKMRAIADAAATAKGMTTAAQRVGTIPLGRLGEPEDIANTVAFIVSEEASYMTGQGINVTGGVWMN